MSRSLLVQEQCNAQQPNSNQPIQKKKHGESDSMGLFTPSKSMTRHTKVYDSIQQYQKQETDNKKLMGGGESRKDTFLFTHQESRQNYYSFCSAGFVGAENRTIQNQLAFCRVYHAVCRIKISFFRSWPCMMLWSRNTGPINIKSISAWR